MKRILACLVCVGLVLGLVGGQCFADPEASLQKLMASMRGMAKDDPPKVVLTQAEEDELIDAFVSHQKTQGRTFTRQQTAILIGQLAGYGAMAMQLGEAFGGGTQHEPEQPKVEQPKAQPAPVPPAPQPATAYDEVFDKQDAFFAKKINKDEFVAYLSAVVNDKNKDSRAQAAAFAVRGSFYLFAGDMQKAQSDLDASIATDKTIPGGYSTYGQLLYRQKKYAEAAEYFIKAAENSLTDDARNQRIHFANVCKALTKPIAAADFFTECAGNPFAAEGKYKNTVVAIRGKVSKIGRTISGLPEITMKVATLKEIEFELFENEKSNVAKIKQGADVLIGGNLKKAGNAIVQMNNCFLVMD